MRTELNYILRDNSTHNTIEKALNHCDEMMGAEMRNIINDLNPSQSYLYKTMFKIVSDKKYDKELYEYIAWRDEKNELEKIEND